MDRKRIQPAGMVDSPAFSQGIEVSGISSILVVGGQNGVDGEGKVVGQGDFFAQCKQALLNLQSVLTSGGYTIDHVIKWTIYLVKGNDARLGFKAYQEVFGAPETPPTITVVEVAGLASPDRLVEIEAMAVR